MKQAFTAGYEHVKAGYEHVKAKASSMGGGGGAGAGGSEGGAAGGGDSSSSSRAPRSVLSTIAQDLRETLLPAQDITSATRQYTGAVFAADPSSGAPGELVLVKQQRTGWQKMWDDVNEKVRAALAGVGGRGGAAMPWTVDEGVGWARPRTWPHPPLGLVLSRSKGVL